MVNTRSCSYYLLSSVRFMLPGILHLFLLDPFQNEMKNTKSLVNTRYHTYYLPGSGKCILLGILPLVPT